jgi:uncharacterized membrane protein YeiB
MTTTDTTTLTGPARRRPRSAVGDRICLQTGPALLAPQTPRPTLGLAEEPAAALPSARRSLAPDLARGAVLLFIALANVIAWLYGREEGAGYRPLEGSRLDHGLDLLVSLLVDQRSFPLFAMLFGYGMWQMARSAERRGVGWSQTRRTLLRRNGLLMAFGLLHAAFLFHGDILLNYGATGLIVLLLFLRRTRTLLIWAGASLVFTTIAVAALTGDETASGFVEPTSSYLSTAMLGDLLKFASLVVEVPTLLAPVLIGVLVGRLGLLDRPWDHTGVLVRTAVTSTAVSLVGGAPYALTVAGVIDPAPAAEVVLTVSHFITGLAGGVGYLAGFALVAAALHGRPRTGVVRALAAVGQRSLSCYLLQSVLFFGLLSVWGLGLGAELGTAAAYGIAVAVWGSTVLIAVLLDRAGRRGPAEVLLRRLTYGRAPA